MIAEMEAANSAATEVDKPAVKATVAPKKPVLAVKPVVSTPTVEAP